MTNKTELNGLSLAVNFSVIALCLALALNMFVTGLPQKIFYIVSYLSVASIAYGLVRRKIAFQPNRFFIALFIVL
ncbi:MAG: O-antigen ligase family protein, partial [Pantoea sp.]|nr:O-antigen ligase family protein [Pantoea sp.]